MICLFSCGAWYGMVVYDAVCCVVWYMVWYGMVWSCGIVYVVWCGNVVWYDMIWYGVSLCSMVWYHVMRLA